MTHVKQRKEIDLLEGPLLRKILLFALPLMATNLLQTLYNAADMIIVGLSTEPDAVGAIGTTGSFINLIVNLFIGFSVGANVVVARHIGARDHEAISRTVHTAICMSVLFGLVGLGVGLPLARPVLALMGNTGKLLELSARYTQIYFCGIPFLSMTNYLIAIFRAKGDTQTPLFVLSCAGLLNVGLNLFFVLGCGMSVEGVALATAIANAASALVLFVLLSRESGPCRFCWRRLRIHRHSFLNILHIGLPAGIQSSLFAISNMLIQSSILQVNNSVSPPDSAFQPVVKGNAAVANLEGFVYTATNSFCQAAATFTSQHMGAQRYERIKRVMGCCYALTTAVALLFSGALMLFRHPLLALYGVVEGAPATPDAIAMDTALLKLEIMMIPYFLLALMEIGSGVLRGLGRSITSTVLSLLGACVFRVAWILTVFRALGSLSSIYVSYPISWALTALAYFIFCLLTLRGLIRAKRVRQAAAA
ncbi:MAG: MATE family efflux transporter [Clostridia bacterium]|nr:MATE family efflux transporter [Clostridia bacterium]